MTSDRRGYSRSESAATRIERLARLGNPCPLEARRRSALLAGAPPKYRPAVEIRAVSTSPSRRLTIDGSSERRPAPHACVKLHGGNSGCTTAATPKVRALAATLGWSRPRGMTTIGLPYASAFVTGAVSGKTDQQTTVSMWATPQAGPSSGTISGYTRETADAFTPGRCNIPCRPRHPGDPGGDARRARTVRRR